MSYKVTVNATIHYIAPVSTGAFLCVSPYLVINIYPYFLLFLPNTLQPIVRLTIFVLLMRE